MWGKKMLKSRVWRVENTCSMEEKGGMDDKIKKRHRSGRCESGVGRHRQDRPKLSVYRNGMRKPAIFYTS